MKPILKICIAGVFILLVEGCSPNHQSRFEKLIKEMDLPTIEYGVFYSFSQGPELAVYKEDEWEYNEGESQSIDEFPPESRVICFIEATAHWTIVRDLLLELKKYDIDSVYMAFEHEEFADTEQGALLRVGSYRRRDHSYPMGLKLLNDGRVEVNQGPKHGWEYASIHSPDLPIDALSYHEHNDDGVILVSADNGVSVGEYLRLFSLMNHHARPCVGMPIDDEIIDGGAYEEFIKRGNIKFSIPPE